MNPAFPTVVYWIPNCWKLLARQRATPQQIPPITSVFLAPGMAGTCFLLLFFLSKNHMQGRRTTPPIRHLTQLNVKGPT